MFITTNLNSPNFKFNSAFWMNEENVSSQTIRGKKYTFIFEAYNLLICKDWIVANWWGSSNWSFL
jgi:hypothetical protein